MVCRLKREQALAFIFVMYSGVIFCPFKVCSSVNGCCGQLTQEQFNNSRTSMNGFVVTVDI